MIPRQVASTVRRVSGAAVLLATSVATATADPPLWRVADDNSAIYLFGSSHLVYPDREWSTPQFKAVLSTAEAVYFELAVDADFGAALDAVMESSGYLPKGRTLSGVVGPERYPKVKAAIAEAGLDPAERETRQPWVLEMELRDRLERGATPTKIVSALALALGPDLTLQAELPAERKRFLETAEEQTAFLVGPLEEQIESLSKLIDGDEPERPLDPAILIDAWYAGDMAAIEGAVAVLLGPEDGAQYRRLLTERNIRWLVEMERALASDQRALLLAGAGHMAGRAGLPALLAARGYSVVIVDGGAALWDEGLDKTSPAHAETAP